MCQDTFGGSCGDFGGENCVSVEGKHKENIVLVDFSMPPQETALPSVVYMAVRRARKLAGLECFSCVHCGQARSLKVSL